MPDKNISKIIVDVCKKENIPYHSINQNYTEFNQDAKKLGELCQTILSLIDEIDIILNRHDIRIEFKEKINNEIIDLANLEHDLINLSQKIIAEDKTKKEIEKYL